LALVSVLVTSGCGSDDGTRTTARRSEGTTSDPLVELRDDPKSSELLAVLARGHAAVRSGIGSHRIHYRAHFELGPEGDLPRPKVGEIVAVRQIVDDELDLAWAAGEGDEFSFALRQFQPPGQGEGLSREIVVVDDRMYSKLAPRPWFESALDHSLHELWLDDAANAAHDAIELCAPRLQLSAPEAIDVEGRPALRFTLGLADAFDPAAVSKGEGTSWRHDAEIAAIEGQIVLDDASGVWRSIVLEVRFTLVDPHERVLHGVLRIDGTLDPADPNALAIAAPTGAVPLPERDRPMLERDELLDGLAGR
jgi:hypothetical protein